MRGIRGAITVEKNSREKIWQAAQFLVTEIFAMNELHPDEVGALIFSTTEDLTAAFPSSAVRQLPKFRFVPVFDTREPAVDDSLQMCIRVLVLADIEFKPREVRHVYLGGAQHLRPDLKID
ncbi:MAG: chorismate mutase [Selenomonadaceae bacterium]|nr:chorismate mutase [Selenomonadaceae bacterium]